jgi:hypothetical protein
MMHDVPSASAAPCWSRAVLEQELGRVHAREFARLSCRAAMLRLRSRPGLPALLRKPELLRKLGLEDDPERWRRAAQRARELAVVDGYEPSGLLRHALAHACEDWAPAASLVREALALDAAEDIRWHAAALCWFENRAGARARLAEFAANARVEVWRTRARILLEQAEQAPW